MTCHFFTAGESEWTRDKIVSHSQLVTTVDYAVGSDCNPSPSTWLHNFSGPAWGAVFIFVVSTTAGIAQIIRVTGTTRHALIVCRIVTTRTCTDRLGNHDNDQTVRC
ncbi:hypothetical protein NP493_325g02073 [Ridgeia piscesae]|uniref:Uncharacterized protein n=1 Tax=Ridgeia piscesae TaxID=27915 RepID=A0AAD9NWC2_RIDPI|nr:hypothetical protein NP493_325g02073 [Ridgeia piscesae]